MKDLGNGLLQIENGAELENLAKAAKKIKDIFDNSIEGKMTLERAKRIRQLRIEMDCTWRSVAAHSYEDWGEDADWEPHSNQLAGMALCEFAAKMFDENYMDEPWN